MFKKKNESYSSEKILTKGLTSLISEIKVTTRIFVGELMKNFAGNVWCFKKSSNGTIFSKPSAYSIKSLNNYSSLS